MRSRPGWRHPEERAICLAGTRRQALSHSPDTDSDRISNAQPWVTSKPITHTHGLLAHGARLPLIESHSDANAPRAVFESSGCSTHEPSSRFSITIAASFEETPSARA